MKTNNLKPCPLCGTTENVAQYSGKPYKGSRQVYCNKCGLQWFTNTDGSYDTWNTRPIEEWLQAELKEREALLEHIHDIANEHLKPDMPYETQEEWLRRQLDRIAWLVKNNIKKERE